LYSKFPIYSKDDTSPRILNLNPNPFANFQGVVNKKEEAASASTVVGKEKP
jgi:hypothetical protein